MQDPLSGLLSSLKALRTSWPQRGWSWDTRFNCVASSFATELETKVRTTAGRVLASEWTPKTLATAPREVQELAERSGGLRTGQLLLTSPPSRFFGYGLWWPWGDGMTTSLRIGIGGPPLREEYLATLREAFGVAL